MATLYMLHVESSKQNGKPPDLKRESLKRFDKWVPCQCTKKCGKEWNFINLNGLSRGGRRDLQCGIERFMTLNIVLQSFNRKELEGLEKMRAEWDAKKPKR